MSDWGASFTANELMLAAEDPGADQGGGDWRVLRARNKWQQPEDCLHHPQPGTYPVVVTDRADWGGWRVPGAEYDRDPQQIERQARLIASAPQLMQVAQGLVDLVSESPDDAPARRAGPGASGPRSAAGREPGAGRGRPSACPPPAVLA